MIASLSLRHYSHKEIPRVARVKQPRPGSGPAFKPVGLWVSVEDGQGWAEWCSESNFDGGWSHVYRITLSPNANVLHVATAEELDRFHLEYAGNPHGLRGFSYIDWRRVAAAHDGIIIAPYQWSRRLLGPTWYYGWDCSSGCIWRPRAIAQVILEKLQPSAPSVGRCS